MTNRHSNMVNILLIFEFCQKHQYRNISNFEKKVYLTKSWAKSGAACILRYIYQKTREPSGPVSSLIHSPQAEKEVLLSCVQEILEAIDENNDGEITREEFVENARKSSFIKDLIGED